MSGRQPTIWQIAAGEAGRFYWDLFSRNDVMFLGPGRFGEYDRATYEKVEWSGNQIAPVTAFRTQVFPGDIVIARTGLRAVGIGFVPNSNTYRWLEHFDDVYGWDLQHTHRVIWQEHLTSDLEEIQKNGPLFKDRKQIPKFTRLMHEANLGPIRDLIASIRSREPCPLPEPPPPPLTMEQLGQALFAKGVANEAVDNLISSITRQRRLLQWYDRFGAASGRPTEHEVVAHMILPLLLSLGWSEQLLAVEWKKIDLAAFTGTPTVAANCVLVCEAKSAGYGMQGVLQQALDYVTKHQLDACQKVLLTEGGRFYLYEWHAEGKDLEPVGYLNIEKIRTNHTAPAGTNAIDTIVALTPAGIYRPVGG